MASARRLGADLGEHRVDQAAPSLALVSPAARTQETATAVFSGTEMGTRQITDARLYHATPDEVLDIVRELPDDVDVVCVVGHNPTIQCLCLDLVSELSLDGPHPALNAYRPGTLSIIELPIESWSKASFAEGSLVLLR
jgi:phosphohistidine phosphatase